MSVPILALLPPLKLDNQADPEPPAQKQTDDSVSYAWQLLNSSDVPPEQRWIFAEREMRPKE